MSCHYQYCMSGVAINNVLSNGNHTNDTNTTAPSSSLSDNGVTVAIASPWVRCVYSIVRNRVRYDINRELLYNSISSISPTLLLSRKYLVAAYQYIMNVDGDGDEDGECKLSLSFSRNQKNQIYAVYDKIGCLVLSRLNITYIGLQSISIKLFFSLASLYRLPGNAQKNPTVSGTSRFESFLTSHLCYSNVPPSILSTY